MSIELLQEWGLWVVSIMVGIGGWGVKVALEILKDIRNELKQMNINFIKQEQQQLVHGQRIDDHEQRLRLIEKTNK